MKERKGMKTFKQMLTNGTKGRQILPTTTVSETGEYIKNFWNYLE